MSGNATSTFRSRAERLVLRQVGDKWICCSFLVFLLSFLVIALGEGWDRAKTWEVALFFVLRVGSFFTDLWGHVLVCDSEDRARVWAALGVLMPIRTFTLYAIPEKKAKPLP